MDKKNRVISWFSCGAASAVATKLALINNPGMDIIYCEVIEEHTDNKRFLLDCEKWFNKKIMITGNDKYNRSIYSVFEKTRYLSGHMGARCTVELKKSIRKKLEMPGDIQVFGYTIEEQNRVDNFIDANNEVNIITPLIDAGLDKTDCLAIIADAGIEIPAMYRLGYKNNNCIGCVKAQSPAYWKKIKIDFPEYFEKMLAQEKRLGVKICKTTINGVPDVRIGLDDLPEKIKAIDDTLDIQCGIFCELAKQDINL